MTKQIQMYFKYYKYSTQYNSLGLHFVALNLSEVLNLIWWKIKWNGQKSGTEGSLYSFITMLAILPGEFPYES